MRADRLVATLLLLQRRGRVTAAGLAAELEVSVATARRDLEALSTAGIPVYPQRGRGGGWQLVGGARTDLTGLTANEARVLFLLLGPAAAGAPAARSALRKLAEALPGTFRADAEAAAQAVVVDDAGWGEAVRDRPGLVEALQSAVVARRQVRLTYRHPARGPDERLVDPWGLADKDGVWYLVAGTERGQRTFRVDRVLDVALTELAFQRPADLDLEQVWAGVVEQVERRRSLTCATVLIQPNLLPVLHQQLGRHCEPLGETADGRVRAEVTAPTARDIARHLAGWGALLHVEGPPEVRAELVRIATELSAQYASEDPPSDARRSGTTEADTYA